MLSLRRLTVILVAVACGAIVLAGCAGSATSPAGTSAVTPSMPGTPGHFDDGQVSFEFPTDWPIIAGPHSSDTAVIYVLAVLGDGTWSEKCQTTATASYRAMDCGADNVSFPQGGIVVKVYRYWGGPAPVCRGDVQANETLGSLAVRRTNEGTTTSWEIRAPGNEFSMPNNVFVEAHTDNPSQLARAEALAASLRLKTDPGLVSPCSPEPSAA